MEKLYDEKDIPLPIRQYKKVVVKNSTKKSADFKPLHPNFCPCVDPDSGCRCGNFMRSWDLWYYDLYGMCEECFIKYNGTPLLSERVKEVQREAELVASRNTKV